MSRYKDRIAAGLCGMCGVTNPSGSLCLLCKEKAAKRAAATRAKRKASKCCLGCGVKITTGSRCRPCMDRNAADQKARGQRFKEAGLCWTCGKCPPKEGITICEDCSARLTKDSAKRYHKRKEAELCSYCGRERAPGYVVCRYHLDTYRDYRAQIKLEALTAYGGVKCVGCSEATFEILEIDHIEGGGCKHRKEVNCGGGGHGFYQWLKRNNYPAGFRVLCPTCNKKAYAGVPFPNQQDPSHGTP